MQKVTTARCKRYGDNPVLNNSVLSLKPGQKTSIVDADGVASIYSKGTSKQ